MGRERALSVSPLGREDQNGIPMDPPIATKQMVSPFGQGHVSVFGPLASMDMNHHAFTIDVGDLQVKSLLEPKPAGIDGDQECVIVEGTDTAQNIPDLVRAEHARKAAFFLCPEVFKHWPFSLEHIHEEKLQGTEADFHGRRRPIGLVPEVQKIFF